MLFHVIIAVHIPQDANADKIRQLSAQEHERAKELQLQRKWLHLWRVAGKSANVSIFDVESPAELHEILGSLPLYPFMEVEVTALAVTRDRWSLDELLSTSLELDERTHADCLRALSRILRRLLPTMSSSPGCMVMGRMRISSVVGRPTPKGAFGVLMRARTPLIF